MDAEILLASPVAGRNLRGTTLREEVGGDPALVVFLRHLGCLFCRQAVTELRERAGRTPGPRIVLVHQGTAAEGDAFFASRWPEAPAVADSEGALYRAAAVERGSLRQLFGPRAAACAVRAAARGHGAGRVVGDVATLPTALGLAGGAVVAEHRGEHSGDHPDWGALLASLSRAGQPAA